MAHSYRQQPDPDWVNESVLGEGGSVRAEIAPLATSGTGTSADPYLGWTSVAKRSNTHYYFAANDSATETFYEAASWIFEAGPAVASRLENLVFTFEPGVVLRLTGSLAVSGTNNVFPAGVGWVIGSSDRPDQGFYGSIPQRITIYGHPIIDGGGTCRVGVLFLHAWNVNVAGVWSVRNLACGAAVTGVSVANGADPVFTKVAHGFLRGNAVKCTGMVGAGSTIVNNTCWIIDTVPDADTFTLGPSITTTGTGTGGTFRHASIGFDCQWLIESNLGQPVVASDLDNDAASLADIGVLLRTDVETGDDLGFYTTTTRLDPRVEYCRDGLVIHKASSNVISTGALEFNTGWGAKILGGTHLGVATAPSANIFIGSNIEQNTLGDLYDWPTGLSSANILISCVCSVISSDEVSRLIILGTGKISTPQSLTLETGNTGTLSIKPAGTAVGQAFSVVKFGNGMAATLGVTGDSYIGFGSQYALTFSFGSGSFLPINGPEPANDFNLINATGRGINFGFGITRMAAYTGSTADFYVPIRTVPIAVAALPAAATGNRGSRMMVTDSNAAMTAGIGAVVAAGGANNVPVYSDGTNWRIG